MVQWRRGGGRSGSGVALARPAPEHSFTRDYVCVHEHPQGSGSCIDRLHLRPRSAALPCPVRLRRASCIVHCRHCSSRSASRTHAHRPAIVPSPESRVPSARSAHEPLCKSVHPSACESVGERRTGGGRWHTHTAVNVASSSSSIAVAALQLVLAPQRGRVRPREGRGLGVSSAGRAPSRTCDRMDCTPLHQFGRWME